MHEVRIRTDPHMLQHLLHRQKCGPQHLFRLAEPEFFEVLSRSRPRLLLEEVAEARWREIHESGESGTVPRGRGFVF